MTGVLSALIAAIIVGIALFAVYLIVLIGAFQAICLYFYLEKQTKGGKNDKPGRPTRKNYPVAPRPGRTGRHPVPSSSEVKPRHPRPTTQDPGGPGLRGVTANSLIYNPRHQPPVFAIS